MNQRLTSDELTISAALQADLKRIPFSRRNALASIFLSEDGGSLELIFATFHNFGTYARAMKNIVPLDAQGNPLTFNVAFFPHMLRLETDFGFVELAFDGPDSLLFHLPPGVGLQLDMPGELLNLVRSRYGLALSDSVQMIQYTIAHAGVQSIQSDFLKARDAKPGPPNSQFRLTVSSEEENVIELRFGENGMEPRFRDRIPPFGEVMSRASREWVSWVMESEPVGDDYFEMARLARYALWINLLPSGGRLPFEAACPSKAFFFGVWPWDTCFHILGYQHINMELARNQIRVLMANQLDNGMLPDIVHRFDMKATCTKPPVEAWAVWKLHEKEPDLNFLHEMYEPLVRITNWWRENRDEDGDGICQYNHYWDGGWDNSPIFDEGMPVEAPDLSAHLAVQMELLARIACELGDQEAGAYWKAEADALAIRLVEHSFDPDLGYFLAPKDGIHTSVQTLTLAQLFPLVIPMLNDRVVERLVQHLTDPSQFWGPHGLPTVAFNDPNFSSDYWRGPIWLNVLFRMMEGLQQHGYKEYAIELRDNVLQLVADNGIYENYEAVTGAGQNAEVFGWTTAVFLHLIVQKHKGLVV